MMNRRDLIKLSSMVGIGSTIPNFVTRTALAAPESSRSGARDTILVVVQLTGGNDGLNTVIPLKDPEYAKLRPTIKIDPNATKKIDANFGLHPAMDGMASLLEDRALSIVQGVGYPNASQSHFRSMDIWQAASLAENLNEGWVGRALKSMNSPAFHIAAGNESAPLALSGSPVRVPSIASLADFQLRMTASTGSERRDQKAVIEGAVRSGNGGNDLLDFVSNTARNTYASSQKLQEIGKNYAPKVPYPQTDLANRLKLCAQLIDAGLGSRIFYVSIDGFDTHASQGGQTGSHANLLTAVSGAIGAFYRDMAARGHKDRLMVMTFSEFGRRAGENGSKGTDHGSGAPMFLVGGKVKPGLLGEHPSLTALEMGNLKHSIDFRRVYAGILDRWLGVSSKAVLGAEFEPLDILA